MFIFFPLVRLTMGSKFNYMDPEFLIIYKNIVKSRCPEDVFGQCKTANELKKIYRSLVKLMHPDFQKDKKTKYMATEATKVLNDYYSQAQDMISNNTYGKRNVSPSQGDVEMTFEVNGYEYHIFANAVEGDFCKIYFGERIKTPELEKICLKIPIDKQDNHLMAKESKILTSINHKSLPVLLDSFLLDGKRTNVIREIEDSYDLYSLRKHFPNGLPQEHTVWVLDRLLSVLGFLHTNFVIHGSIEPGNIMVAPYNHNGLLIDFLLSIPDANQDTAQYVGLNDYSAPEITANKRPDPASDMFSLGKSMVYLLGGDIDNLEFPPSVDSRIVGFIQKLLKRDPTERARDAWEAWHQLKDLRKEVFGASSQFLELKIGGVK